MTRTAVGEVRPSQMLWSYGPGALVDLPNLSVITLGLDQWDVDRCRPIEEARLLGAVRRVLGPQVSQLRMPPVIENDDIDPFSAEAKIGVPVLPFPRWLRCVRCGLLAEIDSGLFELKEDLYRPDQTHYKHRSCEKGSYSDAVPARFLLACRNGHLDDFPWRWFVHSGPSDCKGTLRFFESGASLQTENLWVKCDGDCGSAKSLVHAFGMEAKKHIPACRGRLPHLDNYDPECDELPRTVLLGATNSWFPIKFSILAIPFMGDTLAQIVEDGWEDFRDLESIDGLRAILPVFRRRGLLVGIEKFETGDIWEAIERRKKGPVVDQGITELEVKLPEWEVLTHPNPPTDWPHFYSERVSVPTRWSPVVEDVLLVKRLREVNALIGFTRVEPPEESDDPDERPPMASLWKNAPQWTLAGEVHGEGIFLRFSEEAIAQWEQRAAVGVRDAMLRTGHEGWRNARRLDPNKAYPGIRYALLHTFAHLLLRELALECGYNAASIRERIYASSDETVPMAGVLLYTAASDSDGTLGGLIELGKPENLGRLIDQALERATICSSDPLCSEHEPEKDRSLHASACHACAFVPETSCEKSNRYLDRALLVATFETSEATFFGEMVRVDG